MSRESVYIHKQYTKIWVYNVPVDAALGKKKRGGGGGMKRYFLQKYPNN